MPAELVQKKQPLIAEQKDMNVTEKSVAFHIIHFTVILFLRICPDRHIDQYMDGCWYSLDQTK